VQSNDGMIKGSIKALFFDVFGTLVDWRTSVAREAQSILAPRNMAIDWLAFADAWRNEYQPAMEEVRAGRIGYTKLDVLHRQMLAKILPRFGLEGLDDNVLANLTLAWHRLDAWPDVQSGLARLRERFLIAPVSNGNIALLADLARRNAICWDAILGAEIARDFKPQPAVYLAAADAFNLKPNQCLMCAAHASDLKAAAACGLRVAYIVRAQESPASSAAAPKMPLDLCVRDTLQLAERLGA
jgi:2-haloacid dehalogenase